MSHNLSRLIPQHSDFPEKGIIFRDVLPLLQNPNEFSNLINKMSSSKLLENSDAIVMYEEKRSKFTPWLFRKS